MYFPQCPLDKKEKDFKKQQTRRDTEKEHMIHQDIENEIIIKKKIKNEKCICFHLNI